MWGQGLLRPVAGKDPKHMQQQVCRNVHWFARESKDSGSRTLGFAFHMPYPRPLIIFVERGWNYGKYMTDSLWLEFMVSVNAIVSEMEAMDLRLQKSKPFDPWSMVLHVVFKKLVACYFSIKLEWCQNTVHPSHCALIASVTFTFKRQMEWKEWNNFLEVILFCCHCSVCNTHLLLHKNTSQLKKGHIARMGKKTQLTQT